METLQNYEKEKNTHTHAEIEEKTHTQDPIVAVVDHEKR